MTHDGASADRTSMRRRDRAMGDEAIHDLLQRGAIGIVATQSDGQPFLNSNLFVFDVDARVIYLHTAKGGRTRSNIESKDRVCFNVSEMGRVLPAPTALEFSVEYASVTVFGRGAIVRDDAEARSALQLLLDKYCPHLKAGRDYQPITDEELSRTTVYRIDVEEWTGKEKKVDRDFPGAFLYQPAR